MTQCPALLLLAALDDESNRVASGGHGNVVSISDDSDHLVRPRLEALERVRRVTATDVHHRRRRGRNRLAVRARRRIEEEMMMTRAFDVPTVGLGDRHVFFAEYDGHVTGDGVAVGW